MVHFWAKTTSEGKPGISVFDHMVNVGCVARGIAEMWPEVLEYFHLRSKEIGALAALRAHWKAETSKPSRSICNQC